jgi:hypothetical protein
MQGSLKNIREAGGPDRSYRDQRGTLEDKNKLAYFCSSRVPVELLSDLSAFSLFISVKSVCSAKQNLCPEVFALPCDTCVAEGDPCPKFLSSVVSVPLWFDDPPKEKLHLTSWRKKWN